MQHFKWRLDEEEGKRVCAAGREAARQRENLEVRTGSSASLEMHLQPAGRLMGWKQAAHHVFIEKDEGIN